MTPQPARPPALYDAPVLAHVVRGRVIESVHRASLVATSRDGGTVFRHGGIDDPVFPRSSNKPLQALAMVRSGLDLPSDLLALVCASHSGEPVHLEGVRRILDRAGLSEDALQNTPDLPLDPHERRTWTRADRAPTSLAQNCSGKHAGMLATCVGAGWPTETYLDEGHPLQQAVADTIADLAGEDVAATATDGCGAPVMAISLHGLARAFGRLASADPGTPEGRVAEAMRCHPRNLGGSGRDVTALIEGTPGLIAKDGAEAVYAVGLADGTGVAVKVADGGGGVAEGGHRARVVIMAAALRRLGVSSTAYEQLAETPVLGHGKPVGSVVAVGV